MCDWFPLRLAVACCGISAGLFTRNLSNMTMNCRQNVALAFVVALLALALVPPTLFAGAAVVPLLVCDRVRTDRSCCCGHCADASRIRSFSSLAGQFHMSSRSMDPCLAALISRSLSAPPLNSMPSPAAQLWNFLIAGRSSSLSAASQADFAPRVALVAPRADC